LLVVNRPRQGQGFHLKTDSNIRRGIRWNPFCDEFLQSSNTLIQFVDLVEQFIFGDMSKLLEADFNVWLLIEGGGSF
jgi:hypothetical protein